MFVGDPPAHVGDIDDEPVGSRRIASVAAGGDRDLDLATEPQHRRHHRLRAGQGPCVPRSKTEIWRWYCAKCVRLVAIGPDAPDGRSRMSTS